MRTIICSLLVGLGMVFNAWAEPTVKLVESLDLLMGVVPGIKKVAIISDTGETSRDLIAYAKTLKLPTAVEAYDQPVTFEEWKQCFAKYQVLVDAVMILKYDALKKDAASQENVAPAEVMAWTMANNKKPTIGVYESAIKDGVLCGIGEAASGSESGRGLVMFNLKTAEKLNLVIPVEMIQASDMVVQP
jgi:hypothetical protein